MKVNGEIVFGATVAVPKAEIELAKTHNLMQYKKDTIARDLGMKIAEEKGWHEYEEDDLLMADMRLYVFTPTELSDFMYAKFKAKLQQMAATEERLTGEERQLLIDQSERF